MEIFVIDRYDQKIVKLKNFQVRKKKKCYPYDYPQIFQSADSRQISLRRDRVAMSFSVADAATGFRMEPMT